MKRFFGTPSTQWESLTKRLHVYCLPAVDSCVSQSMEVASQTLAPLNALAFQPPAFFHATVQQLTSYESDINEVAMGVLVHELEVVAATIKPFTLSFQLPEVTPFAVEAHAEDSKEWDEFLVAIRKALVRTTEPVLPPPPPGPHMTVRYAIDEIEDSTIERYLHQPEVMQEFPAQYVVKDFDLVSVDQNREDGTFTFESLHHFSLKL